MKDECECDGLHPNSTGGTDMETEINRKKKPLPKNNDFGSGS